MSTHDTPSSLFAWTEAAAVLCDLEEACRAPPLPVTPGEWRSLLHYMRIYACPAICVPLNPVTDALAVRYQRPFDPALCAAVIQQRLATTWRAPGSGMPSLKRPVGQLIDEDAEPGAGSGRPEKRPRLVY